jgi:hypothetical protein
MKIHSGVLLSPATCAAIGPALQDFLASLRVSGLQAPSDVRIEIGEVAELGRRFQAAQMAKRAAERTSDERPLANGCSPSATSESVTYSSAETAKSLDIGPRAAQRRAKRGSLPATRIGREWRFDAATIDRLAKGKARNG